MGSRIGSLAMICSLKNRAMLCWSQAPAQPGYVRRPSLQVAPVRLWECTSLCRSRDREHELPAHVSCVHGGQRVGRRFEWKRVFQWHRDPTRVNEPGDIIEPPGCAEDIHIRGTDATCGERGFIRAEIGRAHV